MGQLVWRSPPNYEGLYLVSDTGLVTCKNKRKSAGGYVWQYE